MRFILITPIYTASRLTGGGQRTILVYRALLKLGKVDIVLISEEVCRNLEENLAEFHAEFPEAEHISIIRSTPQFLFKPPSTASRPHRLKYQVSRLIHAVRPRSHFYSPSKEAKASLHSLLDQNKYNVIVGRYLQATALSGAFSQVQIPIMVDLDDLDEIVLTSRIQAQGSSVSRKIALRLQLWQTISIVKTLRDRCEHLFVSTADDLPILGKRSATVLPNIPFPKDGLTSISEDFSSKILLFVGSFGHRVNREGIEHFARHCWPHVKDRVPEARLRIVGSGGWETVRDDFEGMAGVEVVGKVDDLDIEYCKAALCVSPIFEGAGTKIKILESLINSRVIVAAAYSVRGFDNLKIRGVVAVQSDEEMISQCSSLLNNPTLRKSMSHGSQKMIAEHYSLNSVFDAVKTAFDRVGLL